MVYKRGVASWIFDIGNNIFLVFLIIVMLYPLIHVLFASLSDGYELMAHTGILLIPAGFSLAAYRMVSRNPMIVRGVLNTFFLTSVGTAVNLLLTSMGAYVLSRKNVYWNKFLMIMVVFTMFFSGGLIPFYLQVKALGLINSRWSLIFGFAINVYYLIIMRTYFNSIPESLAESAKMDGANDFAILFRIILPVAMPVVATMILFYGVYRWNEYFYAMIFLQDRLKFPISLILREILIIGSTEDMMQYSDVGEQETISDTIKFATTMVATIPILLVYPFLQKHFVKGAMLGSIKG